MSSDYDTGLHTEGGTLVSPPPTQLNGTSILLHIQTIQSILYLRMYMRHCHAYILVNKSHNNAVVTNNFFLLVYVIILFALYILHIYYYGILRGGWIYPQIAPEALI